MRSKQLVYKVDNLSIDNNDLMVNETVFHNANGYIGIRSNFEEGYPEGYDTIRGSYINGFYDIAEMKQAEKLYGLVEDKQTMLNIADTQSIFLKINGIRFNMFEGTVLSSERWLDMEQGITGRSIVWRAPNGNEVEIVIKRMTSFYQLSLFTIEYAVKALNFSGTLEFESLHIGEVSNYCNSNDPRIARDSARYLMAGRAFLEEEASYLVSHTVRSGLSVCTGVKHLLSKPGSLKTKIEGHSAKAAIQTSIEEKETVTLTKYTVFSDSLRKKDYSLRKKDYSLRKKDYSLRKKDYSLRKKDYSLRKKDYSLRKKDYSLREKDDSLREKDCLKGAMEEMEKALKLSLPTLYHYQKEYLKEYWDRCFLEIEGDDDLTAAVNYNMYQLIQSVGKDEYCNIAAKGLSGEGYEGHYFWDTEMYIQPFFNLTEPEITKNLISFRYRTLEKARENARILGHKKGALYPWRTIMGTECSGYYPSGSAGYHINGDIAHAVTAYYLSTKDIEFIAEKGAEILFETARLWMDVGNYYQGSFRINCVTGPDEYTCMVNNNYYTNVCAQHNLNWAVKFYHLLKEEKKLSPVAEKIHLAEEEIKEFDQAAKCMYLPYDEKLKINPQDDSFLQKKVWDLEHTPKEEFPLLLHYHPLHLYRYQVCKQADTVLAHFIFEDAQSLETIRNSFDYYEKITTHDSSLSTCIFSIVASKLGLTEKAYEYFGDSAKLDLFNTHKNTKDGIHTANMGGNYMAIVYGFAGLRIKEDGIHFAPSIPKQWREYRFKINYEDSQLFVEINSMGSKFSLLKGSPKQVFIRGKRYELKDTLVV